MLNWIVWNRTVLIFNLVWTKTILIQNGIVWIRTAFDIETVKVVGYLSRGWPKDSLFNSYYTKV